MRLLLPDELPAEALTAVHRSLEGDGEQPENWSVGYVWESDRQPPTYAVVMRWEEEVRAYTVAPEGEGYEAWEVTR